MNQQLLENSDNTSLVWKLGLWVTLLVTILSFGFFQDPFLLADFEIRSYMAISVTAFYYLFLILFVPSSRKRTSEAIAYVLEALFGLYLYLRFDHSEAILIYWNILIALSGRQFGRPGALITSMGISLLFSVGHSIKNQDPFSDFYFSLVINNLTFLSVALLSGSLSKAYERIKVELEMKNAALSELQNLQQFLIDQLDEGLISVEPDQTVVEINPAALRIFGVESFSGGALSVISYELAEKLKEFQASRLMSSRIELHHEKELERQDLKIILTRLQHMNIEKGYLITVQNVTRERQLEESMRQSEKLAAVGQMAAGIAHEIRNPLASISGSIQLLDSMLTDRPDEKQLMKISIREIDRLNNMITEFMEFVRPDKVQLNPTDLSEVMRETIELLKVNTKLRQDVSIDFETFGPALILADLNKLKQALLNITINSYQAMEKANLPRLVIKISQNESRIHLFIQDSGCGMDEKTRKRMFEPFLTTKPKGTGLGLAVTHKIIEMHHAQVLVKSEVGVGTEFELVFPEWKSAQ